MREIRIKREATKLPISKTQLKEIQPEIDTSDWKTYRNEEYGFEVKYPKWLTLVEVSDRKSGAYVLESRSDFFSIRFFVTSRIGVETLDDFMKLEGGDSD
ncbi:MAG: hypothetical protein ACE5IH_09935, partial [Thermodesulfobacteriota bacterium]